MEITDKCPICDSKFNIYGRDDNKEFRLLCLNDCFKFDYSFGDSYTYIFGKEFCKLDQHGPVIPKGVEEEVKYWKENERYLTKILTE